MGETAAGGTQAQRPRHQSHLNGHRARRQLLSSLDARPAARCFLRVLLLPDLDVVEEEEAGAGCDEGVPVARRKGQRVSRHPQLAQRGQVAQIAAQGVNAAQVVAGNVQRQQGGERGSES